MAERIGANEERLEEGLELIGDRDRILAGVARAADRLGDALGAIRQHDPQDHVVAGALGLGRKAHRSLVRQLELDRLDRRDREVAHMVILGTGDGVAGSA